MGVTTSRNENGEGKKKSKEIDHMLVVDKKKNSNVFKLLLLGAGDSGKSTIVKQMRILHANGFGKEEIALQQSVISGNIVQAISTIARAMPELGVKFHNAEREADAIHVINAESEWSYGKKLQPSDWQCLERLWKDEDVQACFDRSSEYQLPDSTK